MLLFAGFSVAAAPPRRVLVVQSFGGAAPPFTTHAIAFETELTEQLGEPVDLDEISMDMARYADPDMQEALVDYIYKRVAKWQPDLVVPIGSPAGIFVAQYRDRLFPETPIVYCGLDRRRLPAEALQKNAAFVGENFNLPGFVEDILQLAPETTNIVVVIGATPLEQYWAAAFRHEFEPFTNRVSFTWLNELSFDQMLERVSHLPPRSFIFLVLLLRDASGVSHNADEALKRIHAAANAPVNSIFQNQLGLGIVGGRLYPAEQEGIESARIAIRILRGEPASSFPPKIIGPVAPQYDWRELRRWGISEGRLPPGSIVLFREPTLVGTVPVANHRRHIAVAGRSRAHFHFAGEPDQTPARGTVVGGKREPLSKRGRRGAGHDLDDRSGQALHIRQQTLARVHRPHAGTGERQRLDRRRASGRLPKMSEDLRRRLRGAPAVLHGVPAPATRRGIPVDLRYGPAATGQSGKLRRVHRVVPGYQGSAAQKRGVARK